MLKGTKPVCEGSSFGMTKVNTPEELVPAYEEAVKYLEKSITTAFSKSHALGCAKIAFEIAKLRVALLSA